MSKKTPRLPSKLLVQFEDDDNIDGAELIALCDNTSSAKKVAQNDFKKRKEIDPALFDELVLQAIDRSAGRLRTSPIVIPAASAPGEPCSMRYMIIPVPYVKDPK